MIDYWALPGMVLWGACAVVMFMNGNDRRALVHLIGAVTFVTDMFPVPAPIDRASTAVFWLCAAASLWYLARDVVRGFVSACKRQGRLPH